MRQDVEKALKDGSFTTDNGERLARRALANYTAAAMIMPYAPFARAVEARRYDVAAISRQFGTSFEQTAHRLTTLQKPSHERVPFFFIMVGPEIGRTSGWERGWRSVWGSYVSDEIKK